METLDENKIELIVKYLKGQCNDAETAHLLEWVKSDPNNIRLYDEICDLWTASSKKQFNAIEALRKLKKRIQEESEVNERRLMMPVYYTLLRIAAVLLLVIITGALTYFITSKAFRTGSGALTEISAPLGSKSNVTLPDGTKVWLNSGTVIRYNEGFNKSTRELAIEGEAYFDVARNKQKPFIVKTPDITIKVLGTAFNIKAYPGEGSVETTLIRGSLIVEKKSEGGKPEETLLMPNQRATYFRNQGTLYLSETDHQLIKSEKLEKLDELKGKVLLGKKVETAVFTSWKDNRLVFRNESFESLVVRLERWYGVKITVSDKELNNFHFNGTIENETIQEVLQFINYTIPIKYSIKHNLITIGKK